MFKTILSLFAVLLVPSLAMATGGGGLDTSSVSIDTGPFFAVAGIILGALGSIWGVYKVISLMRSR